MYPFRNSDAHLVSQVLRGQKDRYAQLVERYLPAVQAVARAHAGATADTEDIAQETFTDAFRRLNTLREMNKFSHWLMRIARNKAVDWVASEIRERSKRDAAGEGIQGGQETITPEQRELYELLHRELESMPPEQREVLALFHFAGHRTQEIAAMLGLSNAAVRKRLQRGREALGERMLKRMEASQPDREAKREHARKIYGAAVGLPAAWEATAAGSGLVAGSGWIVGALKVASVIGVVCAGIGVASWWSAHPKTSESGLSAPMEDVVNTAEGAINPNAEVQETATETVPLIAEAQPTLPSGDGVVFGVVYGTDDDPLPDTEVHLVLKVSDAVRGQVYLDFPPKRSDSTGAFRFEDLPLRREWYTLWAVAPDGRSAAMISEVLQEDFPLNQRFLEMEPATPVTGTVVDDRDSPIAGARILPSAYEDPKTGSKRSQSLVPPVLADATGAFRIDYLKAGEWYFDVSAPSFGTLTHGPIAAGTDAGTIVLQPGIVLAGRLVNEATGAPLGGINIGALRRSEDSVLRASTTTDESGNFRLDSLAPGDWQVFPGNGWYGKPVAVALVLGEPAPEVILEALPGGEVHGHVREADSGKPIAGMDVSAGLASNMTATTDADGYYVLSGLPADDLKLRTGEPSIENEVAVTLAQGEVKEGVDFHVAIGERSVSGIVIDVNGVPMAGVAVEAFGQRANVIPRKSTSAADGRFSFSGLLPDDHFWIRGKKEGLLGRDCYRSLGISDLHDLEIVMEPPAGFSGQLLDGAGRPVAGFALSARSQDVTQYTSRGAKSTEHGRFAFPGLVSGTYMVTAGMENSPKRELGPVTLAPGEQRDDVRLVLDAGPSLEIAGRVVDGNGRPVVNALVNLLRSRSDAGYAMSDGGGQFRFQGLEPGLYDVEFRKNGYSVVKAPDIRAGTTDMEVIQLPVSSVSGRILNQNGAPIENAGLTWFDGHRSKVTKYDRMDAQALKDPQGEFTLTDVNAGTVTVAAWADGFAPSFVTLELDSGETRKGVEFRLEPEMSTEADQSAPPEATTSLHGLVINDQKAPIAGAYLYLDHRPHPTDRSGDARATSGPDGRFVIESVPVSTTRVLAWHEDYAPAGTSLALSEKRVHEVTVIMTPGGTVKGRLTGGGKALEDDLVSIDSMVLDQRFYDNVYPDGDGYFIAHHVSPGDTTLNVHYKERRYKFPVTVDEGAVVEMQIDLQVGTAAIEGTLTSGGKPVQGQLKVQLPSSGSQQEGFSTQSTATGRYFIDGLPAGRLTMEVRLPGDRKTSIEVETANDSTVVVDVDIPVDDTP